MPGPRSQTRLEGRGDVPGKIPALGRCAKEYNLGLVLLNQGHGGLCKGLGSVGLQEGAPPWHRSFPHRK